MRFGEAIGAFYKRSFDFQGRSSRPAYWWAQLYMVLVGIILIVILFLSASASNAHDDLGPAGFVAVILLCVFVVINMIPGLAVTVRRFHDQDKSGWFYLLNLIPYVGGLIVLVMMLWDGTTGPNRFGEDPMGGIDIDTF